MFFSLKSDEESLAYLKACQIGLQEEIDDCDSECVKHAHHPDCMDFVYMCKDFIDMKGKCLDLVNEHLSLFIFDE